jgi:prophage regulatory protein
VDLDRDEGQTEGNGPGGFVRLPEVKHFSGLSRSSIYSLMAQGKFPRCIPLSPRTVAWTRQALRAWQEERIAAANGGNRRRSA